MNIIELKRIVDRLYECSKEYNRESTSVGIEVKRIGMLQYHSMILKNKYGIKWEDNGH